MPTRHTPSGFFLARARPTAQADATDAHGPGEALGTAQVGSATW